MLINSSKLLNITVFILSVILLMISYDDFSATQLFANYLLSTYFLWFSLGDNYKSQFDFMESNKC